MDISRFREKFKDYTPSMQDCRGEYAVLVPLVDGPDGLSLLYEVRSGTLRHHAAEVCFPGGKMDAGEDCVQCALRETQEELGIDTEHIEVLGKLDFLYMRTGGLVHPMLAKLDHTALEEMHYNPDEVQETFLVSLDWLRNNPPKIFNYEMRLMVEDDFPYELVQAPPAYRWKAGRMEVPIYEGLPHPLWGLTARITKHLICCTAE